MVLQYRLGIILASLLGLFTISAQAQDFDLKPSAAQRLQSGKTLQFRGVGGTPPYRFRITANNSGGSIDSKGLYKAGPKAGVTDDIKGMDANGQFSYTPVTVVAARKPAAAPAPSIPDLGGGYISGFTTTPGNEMTVDGRPFQVDIPNQAYNFKQVSSTAVRFEVRSGDRFCWTEYCDPANAERSELGGWRNVFNPGTEQNISYTFTVDPGSPTTSDWLVIGQFHDYAVGSSPPVAIEMHKGDRMAVNIAWLRSQGQPPNLIEYYNDTVEGQAVGYGYIYRDSAPIQRGRTYKISIRIRFGISNGLLVITRDGQTLVNYSGPLGFGYGNYWRYGIYRSSSPETLAITYGNMTMK